VGTQFTDTLTYDGENRLTSIVFGDSLIPSADYDYDGDGKRVKATINGQTTLYGGGHLEYRVTSGTLVKYYFAGSQRIAMREGSSAPYFFVGDHLGSTSLTLESDGDVYSEMRYKPFGDTAWSSTTATPTDHRYTGQIQDFDLVNMQLYFYNARYYDPALARFTQADTIVPEPSDPQSLNRFSYVNNNPVLYIDPTGHDLMLISGGNTDATWSNPEEWKAWIMAYKGWIAQEDWDLFYAGWQNAENQFDYLNNQGIRLFDWSQCNCADWRQQNSTSASPDWSLANLEKQLQGMKDITIIGHSKGGNVALHYANGAGLNNPELRNIISLNAPQENQRWLVGSNTAQIDSVPERNKRNFNVVNVYNIRDQINDYENDNIENALNISFDIPGKHGLDFTPHNRPDHMIIALLYDASNIVGHSNASTKYLGRH